jgi:hypothetical protein
MQVVYTLGNDKMIVENGKSRVIREEVVDSVIKNNLIIKKVNISNVDSDKFPIINEYDSVVKRKVNDLIYDDCVIACIEENGNYMVIIKNKSDNTTQTKRVVEFILEKFL